MSTSTFCRLCLTCLLLVIVKKVIDYVEGYILLHEFDCNETILLCLEAIFSSMIWLQTICACMVSILGVKAIFSFINELATKSI